MNSDHAKACRIATELLGEPDGAWRMTGIDPDGADLALNDRTAQLAFPQRVARCRRLKRCWSLAGQARAAEHLMPGPYSYRSDPAVPSFADDRPVIVFDGHCVLCSGGAQFVLRHDTHGRYRLLAAQTPLDHALYVHYGLDPRDYETMILIADGVAVFKAEACIRIAQGARPAMVARRGAAGDPAAVARRAVRHHGAQPAARVRPERDVLSPTSLRADPLSSSTCVF